MFTYQLPSVTFSAGAGTTVQLKDAPKQLRGRLPHVQKIIFDVVYTPTTTALPTVIGNNNIFTQCDFWDGRINRFVGGFNHMRCKELLSASTERQPNSDTDIASGTARYFRRTLHVGPPHMAGGSDFNGTDFAIYTGNLENGELRITMGALTSLAADCTAATGTIRVYLVGELLDEVRIPPAYQFQYYTAPSGDYPLPGKALYESVALLNSSSFDAITAGVFATIRLDFGQGEVVPSIPVTALTAAFQDDFAKGELLGVQGEPGAASDDNTKQVNHGTPTALVAQTAFLQPVWWSGPGRKLSKLEVAETSARLQWSGTGTNAIVLVGRIIPQPPSVLGQVMAQAVSAAKRSPKGMTIKTLSKKPYTGPFVEFMPYTVKV